MLRLYNKSSISLLLLLGISVLFPWCNTSATLPPYDSMLTENLDRYSSASSIYGYNHYETHLTISTYEYYDSGDTWDYMSTNILSSNTWLNNNHVEKYMYSPFLKILIDIKNNQALDYIDPDHKIFDASDIYTDSHEEIIASNRYHYTNVLSFDTSYPLRRIAKFNKTLSKQCANQQFTQRLDKEHVAYVNNQVYGTAALGINLIDRNKVGKEKYIYLFVDQSTSRCKVFTINRELR